MKNTKLSLQDAARFLSVSPISVSRLFTKPKPNKNHQHTTYDPAFPKPEKIGRSLFIDANQFYKWLSLKAGRTITTSETLMNSKQLQAYYQKSHTWVWMHVKSGSLPQPFKINRTTYWLERDIVGELENVA